MCYREGLLVVSVLSLVGISVGLLADTTDMCDILRVIDCDHHYHSSGDETLCCTDGHTYSNKCLYVQAKCDNVRLEPMHSGPCTEADKKPRVDNMTTDGPAVVSASDNFTITPEFCADTRPCPINLNPICGNNYIFYVNLCDFNKAKCKDSSLQRIQLSDCKDPSTLPPFFNKYRNVRKRKQRKGNRKL